MEAFVLEELNLYLGRHTYEAFNLRSFNARNLSSRKTQAFIKQGKKSYTS